MIRNKSWTQMTSNMPNEAKIFFKQNETNICFIEQINCLSNQGIYGDVSPEEAREPVPPQTIG